MSVRSIRSLAPPVCPQCGGERTFKVTREKVECQRCGYVMRDDQRPGQPLTPGPVPEIATAPPAPAEPSILPAKRDLTQYKVSYGITHRGGVESFVQAAYTTAMDAAYRQNWDEAIKALRRCIDYRPDFIDGHLWLGRLLDDPAERRDHLTTVLAHEPTHPEALRELMILNGEIQPTGADFNEFTMAELRTTGAAVDTKLQNVRCPRCGSPSLTDDEAQGVVYCTSCGHREDKARQVGRYHSLSAALIKRRSQPVQWLTGERWLRCNTCGSTRTIPATRLAETCPFCGSKNVIEQDALNTFQQPEGMVRFALSDTEALTNVQAFLQRPGERLKNVFNTNQIKRSEIEGVFLPFWVFDAVVEIQRTIIDTSPRDRDSFTVNPYRTETLPEMANNVLISAVDAPPRALTSRLGKYALDRVIAYEPRLLTQHAAEIYTIDFDKAVMDVHEVVGTAMREKYRSVSGGSGDRQVNVVSMIKQMTFRLLLLPVYSVTLFEADGEVRPMLVNGQTGRVVPGRARKLRR